MSNPLKQVTKEVARQIEMNMDGKFIPIPSQACTCGKPVVFVGGKMKFICSRCRTKWILRVSIAQTN